MNSPADAGPTLLFFFIISQKESLRKKEKAVFSKKPAVFAIFQSIGG
jgi:hypothetical protein